MRRPQFTTRDLLLAITLVGVGLGSVMASTPPGSLGTVFGVVRWVLFGVLLGTGIGAPFRRKVLGAGIGLNLSLAALFMIVAFDTNPISSIISVFGGTMIGAGLFVPFRRPFLGGFLGFCFGIAAIVLVPTIRY